MTSSSRRHPFMVIVLAVLVTMMLLGGNNQGASSIALWQAVSPGKKTDTTTVQKPKDAIFYYHDPETFVREFSECLFEGVHCHVLYWHIQKTGGSYLASRLYPIYNMGEWYDSKKWCCNHKFMTNEFWPNITSYCSKKLGVYEVKVEEFLEVIQACQDFGENQAADNNSSEPSTRHRYVGLISTREPIQRSVSDIHQRCNVHSGTLPGDIFKICERCSYAEDADKQFYQKIVNETNTIYSGLKESILSDPSIDIPLYIIDNEQIDELFLNLETILDWHAKDIWHVNSTFHFPTGKSNAEKATKLCDFGMPSELMRQHHTSLDVYHWLWAGGYRLQR